MNAGTLLLSASSNYSKSAALRADSSAAMAPPELALNVFFWHRREQRLISHFSRHSDTTVYLLHAFFFVVYSSIYIAIWKKTFVHKCY